MNAIPSASFQRLTRGDLAPPIFPRCAGLPRFAVDSLAGRYIVFCFYLSSSDTQGRSAIEAMIKHRDRFDDVRASFFGVCIDPQDEAERRVVDSKPGVRFIWDFDGAVSRLYGALPRETSELGQPTPTRRFWMVIDPTRHVLEGLPFTGDHREVFEFLDGLPAPDRFAGFEIPAPVLILPNVFEHAFCKHLISLYDADGGKESGFMRDGKGVNDFSFKRRRDYTVTDPSPIKEVQQRIIARVAPEIERLFFMKITRMERYVVGCYAAEDGGHFRPHRDNTQDITAHRRFAVSINLNGEFVGGGVSFPEYSPTEYKVPPGWAVIFPANILHKVSAVTKGRRYAFLPFVYDEGGARVRAE